MYKIKKASNRFLKDITHKLEWLNIVHYCEKLGFKVHIFDSNTWEDDLIKSLKIKNNGKKAFIYENNHLKFIFISSTLDEFAKIEALLHELGHIILKHKLSKMRDEINEQEANEFVMHVLRNCEKKAFLKKIVLIFACIFFIVIAVVHDKVNSNINTIATAEESIVENKSLNDDNSIESDAVLITRTGECYHTSDCYTIKNSNAISISFYEAQKSYRPCKVCIK